MPHSQGKRRRDSETKPNYEDDVTLPPTTLWKSKPPASGEDIEAEVTRNEQTNRKESLKLA